MRKCIIVITCGYCGKELLRFEPPKGIGDTFEINGLTYAVCPHCGESPNEKEQHEEEPTK